MENDKGEKKMKEKCFTLIWKALDKTLFPRHRVPVNFWCFDRQQTTKKRRSVEWIVYFQRTLNLFITIKEFLTYLKQLIFFNYLYTCRYNNRKVLTLSVTKNNNQGIQNLTNKLHLSIEVKNPFILNFKWNKPIEGIFFVCLNNKGKETHIFIINCKNGATFCWR